MNTGCTGNGNNSLANGQIQTIVDNTAPVLAFSTTGINFSAVDTAVGGAPAAGANYYWNTTDASATVDSARVQIYTNSTGATVLSCGITTLTSSACPWFLSPLVGTNRNVSNGTTSFSSTAPTNAQYVITVKSTDNAGNVATTNLVRVLVHDNVAPSSVGQPSDLAGTLGASLTLAAFANDNLSIARAGAFFAATSATAGVNYPTQAGAATSTVVTATAATYGYNIPRFFPGGFVTQEAVGTVPYTKFLNVNLSQTVAAAPAFIFADAAAGVQQTQALFDASRVRWGYEAVDQLGSTNFSATLNRVTYADTVITAAGSAYPGISGGLPSLSITSNFTTVASTNSALAGSASGLTVANTTLSSTFIQKITTYVAQARVETDFLGGVAYRVGKNFCDNHTTSGISTVNTATDASSAMLGLVSYGSVTHAAPTVAVYAKLTTGTAGNNTINGYVQVGTASLIASDVNAGTITATTSGGNCDDLVTRTYSFTWTPGRHPAPYQFATGNLLFVYNFAKGQSVIGAPIGYTYTP